MTDSLAVKDACLCFVPSGESAHLLFCLTFWEKYDLFCREFCSIAAYLGSNVDKGLALLQVTCRKMFGVTLAPTTLSFSLSHYVIILSAYAVVVCAHATLYHQHNGWESDLLCPGGWCCVCMYTQLMLQCV